MLRLEQERFRKRFAHITGGSYDLRQVGVIIVISFLLVVKKETESTVEELVVIFYMRRRPAIKKKKQLVTLVQRDALTLGRITLSCETNKRNRNIQCSKNCWKKANFNSRKILACPL